MDWINTLNDWMIFWVNSPWWLAWVIAFLMNGLIYLGGAVTISQLVRWIIVKGWASPLSQLLPVSGQRQSEIKYSLIACGIFSLSSLVSRELMINLWPASWWSACFQWLVFALFYETYSYAAHRLLHSKKFRWIHRIHHRSKTVSAWSAYSVHPIEALLIGLSAPIFMLLVDTSLGVIFVYHVIGMIFTMTIHSHCRLNSQSKWLSWLSSLIQYHDSHHQSGKNHLAFFGPFWDRLGRTFASR